MIKLIYQLDWCNWLVRILIRELLYVRRLLIRLSIKYHVIIINLFRLRVKVVIFLYTYRLIERMSIWFRLTHKICFHPCIPIRIILICLAIKYSHHWIVLIHPLSLYNFLWLGVRMLIEESKIYWIDLWKARRLLDLLQWGVHLVSVKHYLSERFCIDSRKNWIRISMDFGSMGNVLRFWCKVSVLLLRRLKYVDWDSRCEIYLSYLLRG